MRLESVNRSLPRPLTLLGREVVTGIAKEPVDGPVTVGPDGIDGDGVGSPQHHGGPDQAVYLYGNVDYAWWTDNEGLDVHPGLFGENLTVSELRSAELEVGDRFIIGTVELEVTAPRIPCAVLGGRVGDGGFKDRFAAARRPGAYLRVLSSGSIEAGDDVAFAAGSSGVTLLDCVDAYYDTAAPSVEMERLLDAPVAIRVRTMLEARLDRTRPEWTGDRTDGGRVFDLDILRSSLWIFNCYALLEGDGAVVLVDPGLPSTTSAALGGHPRGGTGGRRRGDTRGHPRAQRPRRRHAPRSRSGGGIDAPPAAVPVVPRRRATEGVRAGRQRALPAHARPTAVLGPGGQGAHCRSAVDRLRSRKCIHPSVRARWLHG